ncbi:MAG TPA: hypothetical protein VMT26_05415 [Candidatus Bathyarchaeia archaeon]|jgi:hypothetical protein|nr:hypothetical protein [Candidatus Bathyarchaeia archaeon]
MSAIPPTTFAMMILGLSTFILIMFLPALLELKNPKDAGPRRIMEEITPWQPMPILASMEKEIKSDQILIDKILEIISVLPNLEL